MGTRRSRDLISLVGATLDADRVTNTSSETAFSQKLSLKGGTLKVGDLYHVRAVVKTPTTNSTNTLTLKLKLADITFAETAAIDVADNDEIVVDAWFVVQAIGAGSTAAITGGGLAYLDGATSVSKARGVCRGTSANFSSATDEDITVTATWSATSTSNIAQLELLHHTQTDGKLAA